jgi:hypothetical protein
MKCTKCGNDADQTSSGHCDVCVIGIKDPVMWLLETCADSRSSEYLRLDRNNRPIRGYSPTTPHITLMLSLEGADVYTDYRIKRWIHSGSTALRDLNGKATYIELPGLLREQFPRMWEYVDQQRYDCSHCGASISISTIAGRHFAGVYCAACWLKYRQRNSGTCSLCGGPYWNCTC